MREDVVFAVFCLTFAALMLRPRKYVIARAAISLVISLLVSTMFSRGWVEVPAGYVGTVYDPFGGGIQNFDIGEGWHLIAPWAELTTWPVRTQEYTMSGQRDEGAVAGDDAMVCQANDGTQVKVDATLLFHVDYGSAHRLWKSVGSAYIETIIRPTAREAVRVVVGQYPFMAVYSNATPETVATKGVTSYQGKRQEVEDRIRDRLTPAFEAKGIKLDQVLLRNVAYMSDELERAIVNKQVAQQQVLTQQFLLEIEQIKAKQKVLQSEGQAEAIRLRGEALRLNLGVIDYEFVRMMPTDLDIRILPGSSVILNMNDTAKGR